MNKTLLKIYNLIIANICSSQAMGLTNGKAGVMLFFYLLFNKTNINEVESTASHLLDEILENMGQETNLDFSVTNGLSGIGIAIILLLEEKIIEDIDEGSFLEQFDTILLKVCDNKKAKLYDILSVCIYLVYRKKLYSKDLSDTLIKDFYDGSSSFMSHCDTKNLDYKEKELCDMISFINRNREFIQKEFFAYIEILNTKHSEYKTTLPNTINYSMWAQILYSESSQITHIDFLEKIWKDSFYYNDISNNILSAYGILILKGGLG